MAPIAFRQTELMHAKRLFLNGGVLLMAIGLSHLLPAAEDQGATPSPTGRRDAREEFRNLSPAERQARIEELRKRGGDAFQEEIRRRREELRNLPPEERRARLRELAEKTGVTNRTELERRREELRRLPPEERAAKLRELREQTGQGPAPVFSPEEREARRKQIRQRLETQLDELRAKKVGGSITAEEERRLQRLEGIASSPDSTGEKPRKPDVK